MFWTTQDYILLFQFSLSQLQLTGLAMRSAGFLSISLSIYDEVEAGYKP